MPRYYFDVRSEQESFVDEIGEDLPDRFAAWNEATKSAGQSLQDLDGKLRPGMEWCMEVRDELGRQVYAIRIRTHGDS
jgi:hypothetical protein